MLPADFDEVEENDEQESSSRNASDTSVHAGPSTRDRKDA
jgi:hypothetical protein